MAEDILDRPLKGLYGVVSTRLINCLLNDGLNTLREAAHLSDKELLRAPNFGRKSRNELRALLAGEPHLVVRSYTPSMMRADSRKLAALATRRSGKTYRQIGEEFGVSLERARQLVSAGERIEKARAA
jgi:hypothetical protein